jgi:hypothetical protein
LPRGRAQNAPTRRIASGRAAPRSRPAAPGLLDSLAAAESAVLLGELVRRRPALRREAEAIARELLAPPAIADTADAVCASVCQLDWDDMNRVAGKHAWGFVEPTEAAWQLLESSVTVFMDDMKRRMDIGLPAAAEAVCLGIVRGLHEAEELGNEILDHAPDFPVEHAGYVLEEFLRMAPRGSRAAATRRLMAGIEKEVPGWSKLLRPISRRRTKGR